MKRAFFTNLAGIPLDSEIYASFTQDLLSHSGAWGEAYGDYLQPTTLGSGGGLRGYESYVLTGPYSGISFFILSIIFLLSTSFHLTCCIVPPIDCSAGGGAIVIEASNIQLVHCISKK